MTALPYYLFVLIGREDLSSQCNKDQKLYSVRKSLELFPGERGKNSMISEGNEDGMEYLDQKVGNIHIYV